MGETRLFCPPHLSPLSVALIGLIISISRRQVLWELFQEAADTHRFVAAVNSIIDGEGII